METQDHQASEAMAATQTENPQRLKIGDLAREFGLTLRTLRFYEDRGLLCPVRQGPIRLYSARDRSRLQLILKARRLRFTLGTIISIMADQDLQREDTDLKLSPDQISAQIEHLERQREILNAALAELRQAAFGTVRQPT